MDQERRSEQTETHEQSLAELLEQLDDMLDSETEEMTDETQGDTPTPEPEQPQSTQTENVSEEQPEPPAPKTLGSWRWVNKHQHVGHPQVGAPSLDPSTETQQESEHDVDSHTEFLRSLEAGTPNSRSYRDIASRLGMEGRTPYDTAFDILSSDTANRWVHVDGHGRILEPDFYRREPRVDGVNGAEGPAGVDGANAHPF